MHLTYHNLEGHASEVSTANAEETGAPEVEISPEMITAGLYAFDGIDMGDWDAPERLVRNVYLAMEEVRRANNLCSS